MSIPVLVTSRRTCLAAIAALLAGCQAPLPRPAQLGVASGEDDALRRKFRGIRGGELLIDATYRTQMTHVTYNANGTVFSPALGHYSPKKSGAMAYFGDERSGGLPIPKSLRYVRWPDDAERNPQWRVAQYGDGFPKPYLGTPIVDVTVPVASRIPDQVLDSIRKYKGGLILKLRLTPETILVGWEARQGPTYPVARDAQGDRLITDADRMIGGDFCEAQAFNRKINGKWQLVRRKGWQIDPRTGQRIETDF